MKVLIPSNIEFPTSETEDVDYQVYDPMEAIPHQHLDAEALVVWANPASRLREAANKLERLRWVQTLSAGPNDVVGAGFGEDVIITSGRGLHDQTVSEHTVALLLSGARRLHEMRDAQNKRAWPGHLGGKQPVRPKGILTTLDGADVVIWGFGSIAARLAPLLKAFGANVTGIATTAGERQGFSVVSSNDVDTVLPKADALILILPSSPTTRASLDAKRLRLLPSHAWIVNVGRGDTIDTEALVEALKSHRVAGAAIDVFEQEPLPASSPLWDLPNVILSPHAAGGRPVDAHLLIRHNVTEFLRGGSLRNVVDRRRGY